MKTTLILLAMGMLLLAGCASHSGSSGAIGYGDVVAGMDEGASGTSSIMADYDTEFMREANLFGLDQVKLGELIVQKGQNDSVTAYGKQLVKDFTRANQELAQLSIQMGVNLPTQSGEQHQSVINELSQTSASDFDWAATRDARKSEQKNIKRFERAEGKVQSPALKVYIAKTLGDLRYHELLARDM